MFAWKSLLTRVSFLNSWHLFVFDFCKALSSPLSLPRTCNVPQLWADNGQTPPTCTQIARHGKARQAQSPRHYGTAFIISFFVKKRWWRGRGWCILNYTVWKCCDQRESPLPFLSLSLRPLLSRRRRSQGIAWYLWWAGLVMGRWTDGWTDG